MVNADVVGGKMEGDRTRMVAAADAPVLKLVLGDALAA